eukprot:4839663-Pyramimonas_sp.AAC.1
MLSGPRGPPVCASSAVNPTAVASDIQCLCFSLPLVFSLPMGIRGPETAPRSTRRAPDGCLKVQSDPKTAAGPLQEGFKRYVPGHDGPKSAPMASK